MFTIVIIALILLCIYIVFVSFNKKESEDKSYLNTRRPDAKSKPTLKIKNDKLVVIHTNDDEKLKQSIKQMCNSYNQDDYAVRCTLYSFDTFLCYIISL
jgi:flagellar basal body-associated protein FliL